MIRVAVLLTVLTALVTLVVSPQLASASSTTMTFANTTDTSINDLEVNFDNDVNGAINVSNGPTTSTLFPTVSGFGTSTLTLSGASVGNPGQTTYTFNSLASSVSVDSARWTHDGTDLHRPALIAQ